MKRGFWWAVTLVLVALVGWGQLPPLWEPWMGIPEEAGGGPVEVDASFQIPGSFLMWSEGDLNFSGEQFDQVTNPAHIGWVNSNFLWVYWVTNTAIRVTRTIFTYEGQETCGKILPTYAAWLVHVWNGEGWVLIWWGGGFVEDKQRTDSYEVGSCDAGYYMSRMRFWVYRDGYNDPTDIYSTVARFTISGL